MDEILPQDWWCWICRIPLSSKANNSIECPLRLDIQNLCFVDTIATLNQVGFSVLFSAAILLAVVCRRSRCHHHRSSNQYLIRLPCHTVRYLVTFCAVIILITGLAEGLLTDRLNHHSTLVWTQPHLYLPFITGATTLVLSIVYYHHMEYLKLSKHALLLLLLYWGMTCGAEILRLLHFLRIGRASMDVMRFDLNCILLTTNALLLFIELTCLVMQVCGHRQSIRQTQAQTYQALPSFPDGISSQPPMLYLHQYVNAGSSWTFAWFRWLLRLGYRKHIEMLDLGSLPREHQSLEIHSRFRKVFQHELERSQNLEKSPSLWRVVFKAYGLTIFGSGFLKIVADLSGFVGPLVIRFIVDYVSDVVKQDGNKDQPIPISNLTTDLVSVETFFSNGFVLVGAMVISGVIQFICDQYHTYMCILVSIHVRSAVQTMIYDKSLRLSTDTLSGGHMTAGHVTNHMSTDAMNLLFLFQKMHFIWAIPLQIIVALGLLYYQIGISSLLGFGVFVTVMPLQFILAKIMSNLQKQAMRYTDDRLKHSNELLQGMKLLKLYGWEQLFCRAVEAIRRIEIGKILKYNSCYGVNVFVCQTTPVLVTLVAFASYPYLTKEPLTPGVTFTSLALMNMLIEPLYLLPLALSLLVNAMVSAERIGAFFLAPEVEHTVEDIIVTQLNPGDFDSKADTRPRHRVSDRLDVVAEIDERIDETTPLLLPEAPSVQTSRTLERLREESTVQVDAYHTQPSTTAVKIKHGYFSWKTNGYHPIIADLDVEIPSGQLTVIVGSVGSGKSSLLSAICGEMTTLGGTIEINTSYSSIAYSSQKAWIMNASLRDNILFGQSFDNNRYRRVISACALQPDIDILPSGDKTEIGEKGINLSGGQKQRVSLARAMYSRNSIVLLDDPMSALDVHVGGHLFQHGIMGMMLKEEKRTVMLVTHQWQYLPMADMVIVMKGGRVTHRGTFDDICRNDQNIERIWSREMVSTNGNDIEADSDIGMGGDGDMNADMERNALRSRVSGQRTALQQEAVADHSERDDEDTDLRGTLIEKEELQRGAVSLDVYLYYLRNMGWPLVFLVVLTYVYLTGFGIYKNFWLSEWSKAGVNTTSITEAKTAYYIEGYIILTCLCILGSLVTMASFIAAFMQAGKRLHINMLRNIVCSPMRFFDTTPIGRILNRLSSDTNVLDIKLMETVENMAYYLMGTVSALIVNAIISQVFIAELLPVLIFYYFIQKYFITTSRELQRLDSVTKSPVFAHFSETLDGLSTIRAYRDQRRFFSTLLSRIDTNNIIYLYLQTGYCWLGTVLNSAAILVVLMSGLTTVIQGVMGSLEPSLVGLALSYALMVSMCLNKLLRFTADTEMQMNPVERVQYYTQLTNECYDGIDPPNNWPQYGEIRIDRMSARYAASLEPVLRDITVHFRPGEKVGVCGRTGSGKSSLTLALFRLIDVCKGRIFIDGYDAADIPLTTLRQRMSIIPQDPILFTGTIRSNLDPENTKDDGELWHALEIAQLNQIVAKLPEKLDSYVSEGGENYSVGQRQLFCLARAFLRNSRVLVMDEATASIDVQTEKVLQDVVASAFVDKTVITIAHRVSTILECDTIIVLSEGCIIEYDTPEALLKRDTVFRSLTSTE